MTASCLSLIIPSNHILFQLAELGSALSLQISFFLQDNCNRGYTMENHTLLKDQENGTCFQNCTQWPFRKGCVLHWLCVLLERHTSEKQVEQGVTGQREILSPLGSSRSELGEDRQVGTVPMSLQSVVWVSVLPSTQRFQRHPCLSAMISMIISTSFGFSI